VISAFVLGGVHGEYWTFGVFEEMTRGAALQAGKQATKSARTDHDHRRVTVARDAQDRFGDPSDIGDRERLGVNSHRLRQLSTIASDALGMLLGGVLDFRNDREVDRCRAADAQPRRGRNERKPLFPHGDDQRSTSAEQPRGLGHRMLSGSGSVVGDQRQFVQWLHRHGDDTDAARAPGAAHSRCPLDVV